MSTESSGAIDNVKRFLNLLCNAREVNSSEEMNQRWNEALEFLRARKEVAKITDSDGDFPLHDACFYKASRELIEQLLRIHPHAATAQNEHGELALHELFENLDPSIFFVDDNEIIDDKVVGLLIEANPDAAKTKDVYEALPLHRATQKEKGLSLKTLQILVSAYPEAASVPKLFGLPIHCACVCWARNDETADLSAKFGVLIDAYPDGLLSKNYKGQLPLHIVVTKIWRCLTKSKLDAFKTIFKTNPKAANVADDNGCLPLHLVSGSSFNESKNEFELHIELFSILMTENPHAACQPNNKGQLPFHLACKHWPTNSGKMLASLLGANSRAMHVVDNEGKTPLDYAMGRESDSNDFVAQLFSLSHTGKLANQLDEMTVALASAMVQNKSLERQICALEMEVKEGKGNSGSSGISGGLIVLVCACLLVISRNGMW